jgi:nucleotide-binding universal stress UspA family protein
VPFDNSKNSIRALNKAIALANLADAKITLVHVINYHKIMAKIIAPYKDTLIEHVGKFLNDAKKYAAQTDVDVSEKILYGNVSEELFNLINKRKFDLVVVGRRGTNKLTGPSLGSVSNALVQHSKIPVLVVT